MSDSTIHQLGFQSAVKARDCMYHRAKLLYDFNTTSDPIALSQGALILTYYSSDYEPVRNARKLKGAKESNLVDHFLKLANTSWLRLAVQHANSANVPMYYHDSSISAEERLTRKRLWW